MQKNIATDWLATKRCLNDMRNQVYAMKKISVLSHTLSIKRHQLSAREEQGTQLQFTEMLGQGSEGSQGKLPCTRSSPADE